KERNLDGAVRAFEAAAALQPDHFWARCYLGFCYLHLRQWDRARSSLAVCLIRRPELVWPYLLSGFAHTELGAWVAAEADFHHVEQLLRDRPNEAARYALHANRGGLRLRRGEFAGAEADFREAARRRPESYVPHGNLARLYLRQGRFAEADRE